jgi:hypothetical protein
LPKGDAKLDSEEKLDESPATPLATGLAPKPECEGALLLLAKGDGLDGGGALPKGDATLDPEANGLDESPATSLAVAPKELVEMDGDAEKPLLFAPPKGFDGGAVPNLDVPEELG